MGNLAKKEERIVKTSIKDINTVLKDIYINTDECFIRLLCKSTNKYKTYPINALKDSIKLNSILKQHKIDNVDLFLSLNPFKTFKSATKNNLFCINVIAVDVDYKNIKELKDLDPEQVIELLEMDCFDIRIPAPTLIEYGNQIRLIYLIETCYIPKHKKSVVTLAERISSVFAEELKDFGAEKQNLETYFRVPGSINSKNNATVKMYFYSSAIRYTLKELQELWLDELPNWYKDFKKKKKGRKKANNITKLHNVYILNSNRIRDFYKIQEYLNSKGTNDYRARLCFQVRNYTLIKIKYQNGKLTDKDYLYAKEEMLKFNSKFNYPLRENVIESLTRSVNYTQYLYKNQTMAEFFDLTWELAEIIGLESIYKPKEREQIDKDYYNRNKKKIKKKKNNKRNEKIRNENGLTKREQQKQDIIKAIKMLKNKGLKQVEVAKELRKGIATIKRYWNL
ncbi:helix-turn-helix domain-containing protein [Clostridium sp.]|uniref:helix-turn-helix domain-containing protein n=1 Tax=Clostridium sp. TaxID=1506 RepID=UPI003F669426